MQVYKLFFKILRGSTPYIMLYILLFMGLTLLLTQEFQDPADTADFSKSTIDLAWMAREQSTLIDGLQAEIAGIANFKDVQDNSNARLDALFFNQVHAVLEIPEGFSQAFLEGETPQIELQTGSSQTSVIYLNILIDRFLNIAAFYRDYWPEITLEKIVEYTREDMRQEALVTWPETTGLNQEKQFAELQKTRTGFNFLGYTLFAILIMGISKNIMTLTAQDLKNRTDCSPLPSTSYNAQLIAGCLVFAISCWFIFSASILLFFGHSGGFKISLLFSLNTLLMVFWASGISFVAGQMLKSQNALSAVANGIALGSAFLGGVFVPQAILGKKVLDVAAFTPTYWYVRANDIISGMNINQNSELGHALAVQTGFALVFLTLGLLNTRKKRT